MWSNVAFAFLALHVSRLGGEHLLSGPLKKGRIGETPKWGEQLSPHASTPWHRRRLFSRIHPAFIGHSRLSLGSLGNPVLHQCILVLVDIQTLEEAITGGNRQWFRRALARQDKGDATIALFVFMRKFLKTGTRERKWFMGDPGMFMTVVNEMKAYKPEEVRMLY